MKLTNYEWVYVFSNVATALVAYKFMTAFFDNSEVSRKKEVLVYSAYYIFTTACFLFTKAPLLALCYNLLAFFGVTLIYKGSWKKRIFCSIISYIILMAAEMAVVIWFGVVGMDVTDKSGFESVAGILILRLISLVIAEMVNKKMKKSRSDGLPYRYWVMLTLIPIASIYVITVISQAKGIATPQLFICIVTVLAINFLVFYLYDAIQTAYRVSLEKTAYKNQSDYYKKELETVQHYIEEDREVRHDFKNHIAVLESISETGTVEEMRDYMEKLLQSYTAVEEERIKTGNIYIDSIVNYKYAEAKSKKIAMTVEAFIAEDVTVLPTDLSVVLGNILDNAITASANLPEKDRKIAVSIKTDKSRLVIKIKNAFDGNIKQKDGKFLTTKADSQKHGYGLKIVKTIAEKYGGVLSAENDKSEFEVVVILYMKPQPEQINSTVQTAEAATV